MKPMCVLCAKEQGFLQLWLFTRGLNLRGTCAHCGHVSATVQLDIRPL